MKKNLKIIMKTKFTLFIFGFTLGGFFYSYVYPPIKSSVKLAFFEEDSTSLAQKKIVLVLGSGGIRGLAHLGVLEVLEKNKIPISEIVGCSAGSLIGAFYAASLDLDFLKDIFLPLKRKDLVDFDLLGLRYGLSSGEAFHHFLDKNLPVKEFKKLKIPFKIAATDLGSGDGVIIKSGSLIPAILGSSAYPLVYRPVSWQGRTLVDGGVVNPIPVDEARKLKPDLVIAVNTSIKIKEELPSNLFGVAKRSMEISHYSKAKESLARADIVINPDLGVIGTFDEANNYQIYNEGKKAAALQIKSILKALRKTKKINLKAKPFMPLVSFLRGLKIFFNI